jgi:tetratricopeptide (TPR) repeat protein
MSDLEIILLEKKLSYQRRYDTIAHDFLDIEREAGPEAPFDVTISDYRTLDNLIDEAKKQISEIKLDKPFSEYTKKESLSVLKTIDKVIKDKGFEYQKTTLLNQCLKTKRLDCKHYSTIYLTIADVLKLPLNAVIVPSHIFIRWHFDENNYINWETTNAKRRSDKEFKSICNISDVSIKKGVFLKSLSREETYCIVHENKGISLNYLNKYLETIENYNEAIKLNPRDSSLFNNKGTALHHLKKYKEAIEYYDKALELDPKYTNARENKELALKLLNQAN